MESFFCAGEKPHGATVSSIMGEKNEQTVVNTRCFLVIMDEPDRCRSIDILEEEKCFPWTKERLCMGHMIRRGGVYCRHAASIERSKMVHT